MKGLHLEAISGGGSRRAAGVHLGSGLKRAGGFLLKTPSHAVSGLSSSELIEWAGRNLCMSSP